MLVVRQIIRNKQVLLMEVMEKNQIYWNYCLAMMFSVFFTQF